MTRRASRTALTATAIAVLVLAACWRVPPPNLLVVTLDTTRADRLGCYGREGARTPNLDRLAAAGTLFERCVTAVPVTTPSHSTIFTGTYPSSHGVRDNGKFKLPPEALTLAEILKARGYATGAAVGAFPLTREWGLDQGFDFYEDDVTVDQGDAPGIRPPSRRMFYEERPAARVNDAILPWLRANARGRFFAWIHYWDPHQPYIPPSPFAEIHAHDPYQGEIAYVDEALGQILAELERQGVADRTIVAVLGDHGEGLGEHGEDTHSMLLYDSTLHVPLIVRAPGRGVGKRVAPRVGTVDLMPTLLDLLGVDIPPDIDGRSLARTMDGDTPRDDDPHPYYAETLSPRLSYGWGELRARYSGQLKYIHGPDEELFAIDDDPRELANLAPGPESDRLRAELAGFLELHSRASARHAVADIDPATRDRLAALGYLSGDGEEADRIDETLRADGDPPQRHIRNVSRWSACKQAIEERQFLRARELALELVSSEPSNPFYRALLATAHLGLGHLDEAAAVAEEGPIAAQNDQTYLHVAQLLFSAGGHQRGETLLRRVIDQRPSANAHYLLGEMRGALGDLAGREAGLRAALELDPAHLPARRSLAVLLAEDGRTGEAEVELRTVLGRAPLDPASHLNLATLLLQQGRFDEAETLLTRSLELDPGYCKAHLARVAMLLEAGETARARTSLDAMAAGCRDPAAQEAARRLVEGR